ncbi:hypothetical protein IQ249_02730 [Lusitaniella coriacea LEGE 07157]|uniref:Uncharacterized protein n=1 Tax=Lusitaniella coriacea LEGE 07157 TaxID=945747 RepID=A0A8J7DLC9_9CYAN|nr:hypothetical protein [Lusitaniella coriacea]MBE9114803.1 hypothetical protein [Lusitaniella coriacea LEGE 07157]
MFSSTANSFDNAIRTANDNIAKQPICYRGWIVSTQVVQGQLWIRWQHPQDTFPRYGRPVTNNGLSATVSHVKFLIDLAMTLEPES